MPARSPLVVFVSAMRYRGWNAPSLCLAVVLIASAGFTSAADAPSWFDRQGPTPAAHQAFELLASAAADGLEPSDYGVEVLRASLASPGGGPETTADWAASLNAMLHTAVRRYVSDLRYGRVDPQQLGAKYSPVGGALAPDAVLHSAIADDQLPDLARRAAPRSAEYESLRQTLAAYRAMAGHPAWQQELPPLPSGKLAPGQAYGGVSRLTARLIVLADLPVGTLPPPRYEGSLVDGIKSFQERHGLTPDGVIGKETFEQLKVSPGARVGQLELALERLRWTPLQRQGRIIVVNVPEFMLHTYQMNDKGSEPGPVMRVIVGNARKTRTPLFDAEMRFVEFSPYWNVPPSISRGETLPRLRSDPGYFERQGFELVTSDGRVLGSLPEGGLDALAQGRMRIRQKPGARNALGDIKFAFPNADNIYLHHTPTAQLFKRDRRDFSHGCIRVEAPADLAEFVFAGEPEWTRQRIVQAMKRGKSATIRLNEEIPVVIAYGTATVRDGRVHFFPDIYGRDRALRDALQQRSATLRGKPFNTLSNDLKSAH